ncbi:MAG: MFS transporter [Thermaerobacter sp.]|nr:MFS transporter [Thermaerobacter sp.]
MTSDLWWLTLAMGLWGLGYGLYGVLWPLYIEHLGGGAVVVGLISTMAGVATALAVFPGGWLSDRVDRRRLLLWGWVVAVPVPFCYALATRWQWLVPPVLLYFGSAFSTPALQAIIVSEAPAHGLSNAYNLVMGVFGAGMVVGPTAGGYLALHLGYRPVFYVSGCIYLASTLCLTPIRPHPSAPRTIPRAAWTPRQRPRLFQWMLFAGALGAVQGMAWPFVVPYLKTVGHLSVETIGLLGSAGVFCATVSGPVWARIGERASIPRALGYGLGLATAGWMALLWSPTSVGWVLLSGVLRGVGEGSRGLSGVAIGRTIRQDEAGTAYGLFNLATELAGALAPLPGGTLYAHWPGAPLVLTAFLTAVLAWWLVNGLPGRPTPIPPGQL